MKLRYTDHFELPLPPGHCFPMAKYRRLRERIVSDPSFGSDVLLVPDSVSVGQLCFAHDQHYVGRVIEGELSRCQPAAGDGRFRPLANALDL